MATGSDTCRKVLPTVVSSRVTAADRGKPVVRDGETVGRVVDYKNGTAFVDRAPGLVGTVAAKLGWGDARAKAVPLRPELVAEVTDEAVHLRGRL